MKIEKAEEKAESLGAQISIGPEWTWATGLRKRKADEFVKFLNAYGFEYQVKTVQCQQEKYDVKFKN